MWHSRTRTTAQDGQRRSPSPDRTGRKCMAGARIRNDFGRSAMANFSVRQPNARARSRQPWRDLDLTRVAFLTPRKRARASCDWLRREAIGSKGGEGRHPPFAHFFEGNSLPSKGGKTRENRESLQPATVRSTDVRRFRHSTRFRRSSRFDRIVQIIKPFKTIKTPKSLRFRPFAAIRNRATYRETVVDTGKSEFRWVE
jgi:hypothetical protein